MKKLTIMLLLVLTSMTVFGQRYRSGNTPKMPMDDFSIVTFNQNEKLYVIPPYEKRTNDVMFAMVSYLQISFTDNTMILLQSVPNITGEHKALKFEPSSVHHEALKKKKVSGYTLNIKHDNSQIKFKPTDSRYFIKQYK